MEPLGFSLEDKHLRRAGLDYSERVRQSVWPSWAHFEAELAALGEAYYFSARATRDHAAVASPRATVLVFGSESPARRIPSSSLRAAR